MARTYELQTWYTDGGWRPASDTGAMTCKVARSRDQSAPSWPNAVPVSLEAGGGIPCRPNPAATLLVLILIWLSCVRYDVVTYSAIVTACTYVYYKKLDNLRDRRDIECFLCQAFGVVWPLTSWSPKLMVSWTFIPVLCRPTCANLHQIPSFVFSSGADLGGGPPPPLFVCAAVDFDNTTFYVMNPVDNTTDISVDNTYFPNSSLLSPFPFVGDNPHFGNGKWFHRRVSPQRH